MKLQNLEVEELSTKDKAIIDGGFYLDPLIGLKAYLAWQEIKRGWNDNAR